MPGRGPSGRIRGITESPTRSPVRIENPGIADSDSDWMPVGLGFGVGVGVR